MDFAEWEPYYLQILNDFGYDPQRDVDSAKLLDMTVRPDQICDVACIGKKMAVGVTVFGAAPSLESRLENYKRKGPVISAGSATAILMSHGIVPDIMFTDLDGDVEAEMEANARGAAAVILAHGDNIHLLDQFLPRFVGRLMPTCQCRPFGSLYNFGGFTDGDRAVMTARHLGAKRIELIGFDFQNPRGKDGRDESLKLKKLGWAQHIIYDLNPTDVELIPARPATADRT